MRTIYRRFHVLDLGITKCYLLACSEGYLQIDTAHPDSYERYRKAVDALGIAPKQIRYLLLTHHHDDHAGFATRLVEDTGCMPIFHQWARLALGEGKSEETMKPLNRCVEVFFSLFQLIHREFSYPPLAVGENSILISGDNYDLLAGMGIDGKILHTPGHSKDSISVVLSDGNAFVGDAAMNFLNFCRIKYRPIFIEDTDSVFTSWRKLTEHGAKWIYPAHGRPFSADKLLRYLAGRESNKS